MGRGKQSGFTAIELTMVMVIIGILAALAIPSFDSYYSMQAEGAARKLVSDLRFAQQLAINTHEAIGIAFSTVNETYQVYVVSTGADVISPHTRGAMTIDYPNDPELQDVTITSADFDGGATLVFSSLGVPQDAAGVDLGANGSVVVACRGNSRTVTVNQNTGLTWVD
ncbi:MAG: type II secretion system protein [Candidatus Omnitrophica bacterium]|nr:type II secretion system protein [Candidatus Omnitrophota bacterium]